MTEFRNYREMKSLKQISAERKEKMEKESEIVHQKFDKLMEMVMMKAEDFFRTDEEIRKEAEKEVDEAGITLRREVFIEAYIKAAKDNQKYIKKRFKELQKEECNDRKDQG